MTSHAHSHSSEPFELIVGAFNQSFAVYTFTILGLDGLAGMAVLRFLCLHLGS
jgi:hypothetical protein